MADADRKQGLILDKVVLLGRTFDEYRRSFALNPSDLEGKTILDIAAGVSSFCAEANARGAKTVACDLIYDVPPEEIQIRCEQDLEQVVQAIGGLATYRWDFYKSPEEMRRYREEAYRLFLADYRVSRGRRYIPGRLPCLPFCQGEFDLSFASYLLFVYEEQFSYDFHKQSLLEIMRVTRGEARFYPLVTFEAQRSTYVERLQRDPDLGHLKFKEVSTDFEFLRGSCSYLSVTRGEPG